MQNNKGEFFVARGGGAGSKVADAALYHFSTNLGSVKGKSGASFMDNCKPLKRRGLRRPASRLRKAKEAAGRASLGKPRPAATSHERRINREFSLH
jgi:hypothetical protein